MSCRPQHPRTGRPASIYDYFKTNDKIRSKCPDNAQKRPTNAQKRPINAQKRPTNPQKRPTSAQKDLRMYKRDLLMHKRNLLMRKRDLLMHKRDLLIRKRDLNFGSIVCGHERKGPSVFSYSRMCSLTIECVLLLTWISAASSVDTNAKALFFSFFLFFF